MNTVSNSDKHSLFAQFLSRILSSGLKSHYDELVRLRIQYFNIDLSLGVLVPLLIILVFLFSGTNELIVYATVGSCALYYCFIFLVNAYYYHSLASILVFIPPIIMIPITHYFYGVDTHGQYTLLGMSLSAFLYFFKHKSWAYLVFAINLVVFIFWISWYFIFPGYSHNDEIELLRFISSFSACTVFVFKSILLASFHFHSIRKIRQEETRYHQLFDTHVAGIVELDLQDLVDHLAEWRKNLGIDFPSYLLDQPSALNELLKMIQVRAINEASVELVEARDKEDAIALFPHIFSSSALNVFAIELQAISEGRTYFESELEIIPLSGKPKTLWYSVKYPEDGNFESVVYTFTDISDRKKAERVIGQQIKDMNRKNTELKSYIESNMQLENFAYIASHDLKAPIRTVISFSQLLERSLGERIQTAEKEYLDFIISSSQNMQRLVNDLLTYSRVNSREQSYEMLNLPELIDRVLQEMKVYIEESQATIEWINLPPFIEGDPTGLGQLFQNLIGNAIKFRRKSGGVSITIRVEPGDHDWLFSIQDNGIGIDPEFHDKIFLLFRKLHGEAHYTGSGIGLAICKKVVEQHSGDIWVTSNDGNGSTFYFTLSKNLISKQIV